MGGGYLGTHTQYYGMGEANWVHTPIPYYRCVCGTATPPSRTTGVCVGQLPIPYILPYT